MGWPVAQTSSAHNSDDVRTNVLALAICCLVAFPVVAAKPAKKEKAVDVNAVIDLLNRGKNLSASEAERLESEVAAKPDESSNRIELLAYYANLTRTADWGAARRLACRTFFGSLNTIQRKGLDCSWHRRAHIGCTARATIWRMRWDSSEWRRRG